MESSEFRKTINKGYIKLLTPEYAELTLESNDAQQEVERIANLRAAAQNILRSNPVTDQDDDEPKTPTAKRRQQNLKKEEDERQGITIGDNSFDVLLTSLEGKNDTHILNALRNEGSFTRKELKKIQAKFGEVPRVAKFVAKKLED